MQPGFHLLSKSCCVAPVRLSSKFTVMESWEAEPVGEPFLNTNTCGDSCLTPENFAISSETSLRRRTETRNTGIAG